MAKLQLVPKDEFVVPHNLEAEQALLGALLIDRQAFDAVADFLLPEHFYEKVHGAIFEVIANLLNNGKTATPATVRTFMPEVDLGGVTVGQYIGRLTGAATTISNAGDYGRIVRDCATRRRLITMAQAMMDEAYAMPVHRSPGDLIGEMEAGLADLQAAHLDSGAVSTGKLAKMSLERSLDAMTQKEAIGLECGIHLVQEILGPMMPGDLIVVGGGTSMGKAQPLTSMVSTPGGFVPMGDIRVGDEVSSVDGRRSFVTGVFPQGVKDIYEITFIDGRKVRCCKEHLWKAKFSRWKEERVVSTEELLRIINTKAGRGRLSVPLPRPVEAIGFNLPFDAYAIGALIGDGTLKRGTPNFTTTDTPVLDAVMAAFPALRAAKSGKYDYRLSGGGKNPLTPVLDELGLRRLSKDKALDPRLMLMPVAQRLALLQGLMDTDGYIDRGAGAPVFCTSSEALARDVQRLVWSLGGVASVTSRIPSYTYRGEKKTGLRAYRVYVRMPRPKELFRLSRRIERAAEVNRGNRDLRLVIRSIEKVGAEECQCISVSHPDHLYLTDDYVVTHNTALTQQIIYNIARSGRPCLVFSIEMEPDHFNDRFLAYEADVSTEQIENGYLNMMEVEALRDAVKRMESIPLEVVGIQDITVPKMLAEARRMKKAKGLAAILIDHLQFIEFSQRFKSDAEGIASNVRQVKRMAKSLGVPVILISHLNREYAKETRRPTVNDLYGSGAIEKDADVVLLVHREERALAARQPDASSKQFTEWAKQMQDWKGKAEVILGKRRRGKGYGKRVLHFDERTTTFS